MLLACQLIVMIVSDNLSWLAASWGRIKVRVKGLNGWNLRYLSNCAEWVGAYMSVDFAGEGYWSIQACSLAQGEWGSVWKPGVHGAAWVRGWQQYFTLRQAIVLAILARVTMGPTRSVVDPTLARYDITCALVESQSEARQALVGPTSLLNCLPEAWGMPHRHCNTAIGIISWPSPDFKTIY